MLPYNDRAAWRRPSPPTASRIAAVITEGAPANMGVVAPGEGFNAGLRRITREHGALMIFDEVLTGFRVHEAGYWGLTAAGEDGWEPDLFMFGKVIGGGLPVAGVGGRAGSHGPPRAPGPVYQAGHPVREPGGDGRGRGDPAHRGPDRLPDCRSALGAAAARRCARR